MIAASKPKRRIGCERDFGGQIRVEAEVEEAAGPGAYLAIFREVTAGLPHHPDRGHFAFLPAEHVEQGFFGVLGQ